MVDNSVNSVPKRALTTGFVAVAALAFFHWFLIALATVGSFFLWYVALPLLALAVVCALLTLWYAPRSDQIAVLFIVVLAALLYLPPAEELALTGDAAIYVNEGIFVTRTGQLQAVHDALAALPSETRTLFYVTAEEQFPARPMQSYDGILYRSYYMADSATATIETSRMPLSTVWFAFVYTMAGLQATLYSTPFFALLSLLVFYGVARQLYRGPPALLVTVLLAVCYPQIYFGRISYAEIFGQFWTLAGVLVALVWIERRSPLHLVLALFLWATAWSGRIDALLLLPAIYLLLIYAAIDHDWRGLIAVGLGLPLLAALVYLGTNGAYAGATFEIQQWRWPWFGNALLALLLLAPVTTALAWWIGKPLRNLLWRYRTPLQAIAFGVLAFVILWATVPNPLRTAGITRPYQEIIWFSSTYLTPLFYWLLLLGVGRLLFGGYDAKRLWLLALFYSLALVFFYTYTSAKVYPVSLRRLTSDLLPLMALLIGRVLAPPSRQALATTTNRFLRTGMQLWQWVRWPLAAVLLLWMLWLSRPLFTLHEGINTATYLETLHHTLPPDAVVIFEDQDSDSWVGWLAAPLYSLYGEWSLLLDGDEPDPALWHTAVSTLTNAERTVYIATQQAAYPPALQVDGYTPILEAELPWQSTLIGQTNQPPYPPPVWHFVHPLRLYRLEPTSRSSATDTASLDAVTLTSTPLTVTSPNGNLHAAIFVEPRSTADDGVGQPQLYYRLDYVDKQLLDTGAIALSLSTSATPLGPLTILTQTVHMVDEQIATPLGENSSFPAQYHELAIALHEETLPNRTVQLSVRLYNQAMALRQEVYLAQAADSLQSTETGIDFDRVDFTLQAEDIAYYQAGTEGVYQARSVHELPTGLTEPPSENPLTVALANGLYMSITEAAVVNYPRALLARRTEQPATVTTVPAAATSAISTTVSLPQETPWRVVLVAESAKALAEQSDLLYTLNAPSVLRDTTWIRPGTIMRIMKLNTDFAREVIAFAAVHGIDYVEFDAGWYGLGYHEEANPASDATQVVETLDMAQVLAYAREQGVGVWLYVNQVALQQQLDAILPLYASWGIAGIKLGFVDGRSRAGINFVHEVVARTAEHHLMVDVHDNYRPSGVSRTYPNLLTQEGVRGNEHYPGATEQTLLPFTRLLAGGADTTFLYYTGDLNVTRAHQLAAQIVIHSPLRFVLWYDSPVHYKGEPEIDFMGDLPTTWDETRVLDGKIGEYITVARRKGDVWFVGTLTNTEARTLPIALDFLPTEQNYLAQIFRDDRPRAVVLDELPVTAATVIDVTLLPSGGHVLRIQPNRQ